MEGIETFQITPRIINGPGALAGVVDEINRLDCKKVMIVTDAGLVKAGISGKLERLLQASGISFSLFDRVEPDPGLEIAMEASREVKKQEVDLVIGIGGGSSIDIAKAAALLAVNPGDISSYFGIDLIPASGLKTIIIPTTAGTGSETTPIVILSDHDEKLKKGIVSPCLFPDVAILDAELCTGLPPHITAATGMDALIHAVEAYTSNKANVMTDIFAVQAIHLISKNIRTAFVDGNNIEARSNMLTGSLLAGMAFANAGVTAVHAFAYPIGAEFNIPHGIANSIMLSPVMEFNMLGDLTKFACIANILGEKTTGMSLRDSAASTLSAMGQLMENLQLPRHLSEFGVTDSDVPALARGVMKVTRLLSNNPRNLTVKDAEEIYRKVL